MTDNDIIKALQTWLAEMHKAHQTYLEYGGRKDADQEQYIYLVSFLMSNTIALITRQKAEIEKLKEAIIKADTYFSEGLLSEGFKVMINIIKEMEGERE